MPFYQLHIDLEFDGLNLIGFTSTVDPQLQCQVRCGKCGHVNKNAIVCVSDAHEDEQGKSILHYSANCKQCKDSIKIWVSTLKSLIKDGTLKVKTPLPTINEYYNQIGTPITNDGDDNDNKSKSTPNTLFAVLEARGGEVIDFEVINTEFHATANGKEFFPIGELSTDGFYDVNQDNESVSVTLLKYRVQ